MKVALQNTFSEKKGFTEEVIASIVQTLKSDQWDTLISLNDPLLTALAKPLIANHVDPLQQAVSDLL